MEKSDLDRLAENEKEWRQFTLAKIESISLKVDHIDKELATFKIKVFTFATIFGGGAGISAEYIVKLFNL